MKLRKPWCNISSSDVTVNLCRINKATSDLTAMSLT